jgi:hypothetical protein
MDGSAETCLSVFPYIFQAKYIRNKKINENKLVGGTKTWGIIWGSCLRAPVIGNTYLGFKGDSGVIQLISAISLLKEIAKNSWTQSE